MALSYINNKEIKFGSAKPLNGVYTPGSPTREYEPLDSLGIYLNSGMPLSYGVENNRYMSMSDEFVATSQGNSYSFNQFFAAQMMLGFKLHDRFIACDTEHKIIGTESLLHKAYLAEITEKTLDYFKIKIYEEKTRTFCIRMSSSEVPTSYVDLTNSFDENGLNLTQTDRQSFLSYYRFYPLTARDPSSRAEETLGVDYYLLPSAEGLKELSGDILSKFNAFISSDGTLTNLGNTAFAYAGDINYVPNYRGETSEAAVSAAKKAEVILGQVEEIHADINQILPEMKENLELTKQYRDEAMSTEIGTVRTDLEAEKNARIEADTALSTKIEVVSSANRYEIENLKAKAEGKLYRTETVEAEAYTVDVPSSVAPYAEVQKIGGKSVVWNQILKEEFTPYNLNFGSYILDNNKYTYTFKEIKTTKWENSLCVLKKQTFKANHIYLQRCVFETPKACTFAVGTVKDEWYTESVNAGQTEINVITTLNTVDVSCSLYLGVDMSVSHTFEVGDSYSVSNPIIFDLTQMFGSGNEPTLEECNKIFSADYYPFDAGTLKSFPVKRVKFTARNLFDESKMSNRCRLYTDGSLYKSKYYWSDDAKLHPIKAGETITFKYRQKKGQQWMAIVIFDINQKFVSSLNGYVSQLSYTAEQDGYIAVNIWSSSPSDINREDFYEIMLTKDNDTTYTPYRESTLDLSSVTSDLKSAGSVHDEWQNGKVTKRIGSVDLGTLEWDYGKTYGTDSYCFTSDVPNNPYDMKAYAAGVIGNLVCSKYPSVKANDQSQGTVTFGICCYNGWNFTDEVRLIVRDTSYSDASTFKSAMSGVMLYYELATPTEETIPEIDNYINVKGGGTLAFESDDAVHMPVPSTDRFVVDLTSTTEETT